MCKQEYYLKNAIKNFLVTMPEETKKLPGAEQVIADLKKKFGVE